MMQASCKWVYQEVLIVTGDTCPWNTRAAPGCVSLFLRHAFLAQL